MLYRIVNRAALGEFGELVVCQTVLPGEPQDGDDVLMPALDATQRWALDASTDILGATSRGLKPSAEMLALMPRWAELLRSIYNQSTRSGGT